MFDETPIFILSGFRRDPISFSPVVDLGKV